MPAPLSDVLSRTETSPMVTTYHPSLPSAPRTSVSSTSSALGLATRPISATGSSPPSPRVPNAIAIAIDRAAAEWTATPTRSPSHSAPTAPISLPPMSRNDKLTGLGLGLGGLRSAAVPPPPPPGPVDYLSPPWSEGRRVFSGDSDGKPSPGDREYQVSPFGYQHGGMEQRPYSSSSSTSRRQQSESAGDRNGEISNNDVDDAQGCPRRPRILMDARQSALLNALWAKTYFPTTAEREHLAQLASLTPRQVQVWFQNQRQKQRRVLHDPTASQEEKNKLAELRHSPRTRRKLTLAAARMANDPSGNDYVQYGLLPSSSASADRPSPPGESYGRYSPPDSRHYTSVLPSREYVPPKAIVSRTARMSSRTWDDYDRDAYHGETEPSHFRRTNLHGWESEHSPPPTGFRDDRRYASPPPLKRRREYDDIDDRVLLERRRQPFQFNVASPIDVSDKGDAHRLPSISSLNLPRLQEASPPLLPRPVANPTSQRVPSFAALLNAI